MRSRGGRHLGTLSGLEQMLPRGPGQVGVWVAPALPLRIAHSNAPEGLFFSPQGKGYFRFNVRNKLVKSEVSTGLPQKALKLPTPTDDVAIPTLPPTSLTSATTDHLAPATMGPLPSAPWDVVASLVSTRFIKLTWRTPASDPHGDNLTYSVFYTKEGIAREHVENTSHPGEMQVTIQNLMPATVYILRVMAHNKHGSGESSAPLVETQPEVQLPGPAPNIRAYATSPTSITDTWETPLSGNGEIQKYKLYYMGKGTDKEQDINISSHSHIINRLKKYTEYSFVVAYNKHGPGVSTQDVAVQTLSDVSSAAPQNLSLEVRNSKSIMIHWQPPPPATQNEQITGYKIHYRKASKSDVTETSVAGTQLSQLIEGLAGTEYNFPVAALTGNGTGPATDWLAAETFESDLDETRVPEVPSSLHVRPLVTSIVVSWTPPENQNIVVRGYAIGYGIGSPHAQTIKVDYKQCYYTIENMDPSSHYVITLKAFNNVGEGIPLYESAVTRPHTGSNSPHGSPTSPLDSNMLLVIIVSVGVITIVVVVIIALFCTRRTTSHQKKKWAACKSVNGSHKYKGNSKDFKPPDLWIHHERLELKPINKSPDPNPVMTDTPIPCNSQDITAVDNSNDSNIHQRRNSYRGHESEDSMSTLAGRRGMRPKMMMPFDSQPPQPVISAHPIHSLDNPHHHFHSISLASPARSHLYHPGSPWLIGTSMSLLDRASSTGIYQESSAKPPKFPVAGGKPPSSSLAPKTPVPPQSSPAAGPDSPTSDAVLGIPGAIFRPEGPKAGARRCHWRWEIEADRLRVRSVRELP
ncbi:LOW QUALITY PROTEIN: neogenin-like [Molossus nigricans]